MTFSITQQTTVHTGCHTYPLPIHFILRCTSPSAPAFKDRGHGTEPATPALFEAERIEIGYQSRVRLTWGQYISIVGEEIGWELFNAAVQAARATGKF